MICHFKTLFGTSKHTYPIKSHNLRRHFFSKATGTSQPDHHCFFFFLVAFESLWFHSQYQMKTRNIRGRSNPQFSGQVGQEIDLEPKNMCVGLLDNCS